MVPIVVSQQANNILACMIRAEFLHDILEPEYA